MLPLPTFFFLLLLFSCVFSYVTPSGLPSKRQSAPAMPPLRNVMYVQSLWISLPSNGSNGTHISLLPLIQHDTQVTHIIIAELSLDKTNASDITLNGYPPKSTIYDWLWSETSQLQAAGVQVMLMLGGAGSVAFNLLEQDFDSYYPPLLASLQDTNVNGIDLDIEESLPSSVSLDSTLQLLNNLSTDLGDDFIITMAPVATNFITGKGLQGVAWNYSTLDAAATSTTKPSGKIVNWYNVQFYDGYGDPSTTTDYDAMIDNGWDPARLGLGLATYNLSGYYDLETYFNTIQALKKKYPDFGGVDGWEYGVAGSAEDPPIEPWGWVATIGFALFGNRTIGGEYGKE